MPSALQRYLLAPRAPSTAAGFIDDSFAVVDLRRARRAFRLASSAVTQIPPGLVTPGFDSENIESPEEMAEIVLQTAQAAGLAHKKRWSIALPEGCARTLVITLESKPKSGRELKEVLEWKLERVIAAPARDLRISRQRISPQAGQERFLVTIARDDVLSQYEDVFESLGWNAGLVLPRHIGEAQWLVWNQSPGDKMLVSTNRSGFTSVVVRNREPVLIRTHSCEPEAMADEMHRFALYYKDKMAGVPGGANGLTGLLVLGGIDLDEARQAIAEALESEPRLLDPAEFGLDLKGEPIRFDQLAGAAGLATIAWQ
jgi:hypothetical protein